MTKTARLRRQFRRRLRAARESAGLSQAQAASGLDWSPDVLAKVESGQSLITQAALLTLLRLYGADDAAGPALLDLARQVKYLPWQQYADVLPPGAPDFFGLESSASLIRHYEPHLVPGLLQTPDYTRSLLKDAVGLDDATIERSVEIRAQRQELLERAQPPEMFFIVSEAAIRQQVGGPRVMTAQIGHLVALAARTRLTLQIIPFQASAHPGMLGPFVVFEFDSETAADVLYLEYRDHLIVQDDDAPILHRYVQQFWDLERIALTPEGSAAFLTQIAIESAR